MYGPDETTYVELRNKFVQEMNDIEEQIRNLDDRWNELHGLLAGEDRMVGTTVILEEVDAVDDSLMEAKARREKKMDAALTKDDTDLGNIIQYLKMNPGTSRSTLQNLPVFRDLNMKRLLEKGKRHGKIVNTGLGRASVWSAVEG